MGKRHDQSQIEGYKPSIENKDKGVYVLTHPSTDTLYVGSTLNMYRRRNAHLSYLCNNEHPNHGLQEKFNSEPRLELTFLPMPDATIEQLRLCEKEVIEEHLKSGKVLNIQPDPTGPVMAGLSPSVETRKKLSEAMTGRFVSDETRMLHRNALLGKEHTEDTKENISSSMTKFSVVVDGIEYKNATEAAIAVGVKSKGVIRARCLSDNYPNYQRVPV